MRVFGQSCQLACGSHHADSGTMSRIWTVAIPSMKGDRNAGMMSFLVDSGPVAEPVDTSMVREKLLQVAARSTLFGC
jgi:hypothetical protein